MPVPSSCPSCGGELPPRGKPLAKCPVCRAPLIPAGVPVGLVVGIATGLILSALVGIGLLLVPEEEAPAPPPEVKAVLAPVPVPLVEPPAKNQDAAIDVVLREGKSLRIPDGPSAVTTLTNTSAKGPLIIGYADGSTAIWDLQKPVASGASKGPKLDGPVERILFINQSRDMLLGSGAKWIMADAKPPYRSMYTLPWEVLAVTQKSAPWDEGRIAVRHDDNILIRTIPKHPDVLPDEVEPLPEAQDQPTKFGAAGPLPMPSEKLTGVFWDTRGENLMASLASGKLLWWHFQGDGYRIVNEEHKAAVRAWAQHPETLVTGDDTGYVGRQVRSFGFATTTCEVSRSPIVKLSIGGGNECVFALDAKGVLTLLAQRDRKVLYREKWAEPRAEIEALLGWDALALSQGRGVHLIPTAELRRRGVSAP